MSKQQDISRRVISAIVLNEDSVLSRISGLFSARGYNIDTLTVAPIANSEYSRFSIVTRGEKKIIEQIVKQLNKLIPVLEVIEHTNAIEKDTALLKIPNKDNLDQVEKIAKTYSAIIQETTKQYIIISATSTPDKVSDFIDAMNSFEPLEVVRSGVVAIER